MSIYVEILIRARMEELWQRTQDPGLHERWDLRFGSITYLPRADDSEPQRFLYATRIGFGLTIEGRGESIASRDDALGKRSSSLRFWSDDWKSLIRDGAGYWQYVPVENGIRFLTAYNYQTRFGRIGGGIDRLIFRPLMGWATAWSFDRLRLWIEQGIDPAVSLQQSLVHLVSRVALASVWIYQGLVPKLIARHADELAMLADAGIAAPLLSGTLAAIGWGEVLMGAIVLLCFRRRWPMILTIVLMLLATIAVSVNSPMYLAAAFNPVSLNMLVAVMALVDLLVLRGLPSARNCLRKEPENV